MIGKKVVFRVTVPYHGEGTKSFHVNLREGFYFSGLHNEGIERVSNIMTTATPTDRPIRGGTQDQKNLVKIISQG